MASGRWIDELVVGGSVVGSFNKTIKKQLFENMFVFTTFCYDNVFQKNITLKHQYFTLQIYVKNSEKFIKKLLGEKNLIQIPLS